MGRGRETGRNDPAIFSARLFHKWVLGFCLILSISLVILTRLIPARISTHWWLSAYSSAPTSCASLSSGPTTLSHIVFGLAGSAATWHNRRYYSELWWTSSTRGFVWLDESPPENYTWPVTSPPYRVGSSSPDRRSSDRIARILKLAYDTVIRVDEVRWFVMGDDDTVFFKDNLVRVLSRYDHRQMWYIGAVSESVEQNVMHSYLMAFGGGGFAISYTLACHLSVMIDGCVERYSNYYGSDEKVSACVGELGVPLTRESGFHQLDVREDPYGLLAAHPVAPLVSLHHLDIIKPLFPHRSQLDSLKTLHKAYELDPGRIMQQSICYSRTRKWSVSVAWGYTVQLYPWLIPCRELELPLQTFKTWHTRSDGPFVFNTRLASLDPCQQPIVYFFDGLVETNGGNKTLATYKRFVPEDGKVCDRLTHAYARRVETITLLASKMDPAELMKAPRRQCCEIKEGWSFDTSIQIVVRTCKLGETITA